MSIAVTGGIAEGKSTVLNLLGEMGYTTLSADVAARQVFFDPEVNALLAAAVGATGTIQPGELRDKIFGDSVLRRRTNAITHPRIMHLIAESNADFVEVPLLFEVCAQHLFLGAWVVTCGPEVQRERLTARLGSAQLAEDIIRAQLPTEVKLSLGNRVIRTNCDLETVRRGISEALRADSR